MITVTGATGHLGRLAVEDLLARGVPASEIIAPVRTPAKAADLAERGVNVREADYSRPETLPAALTGTDRLLLVSSSEVGQREQQHRNAIEAAKAAGVGLIAYTSILRADTSNLMLAAEHLATERILREAGIPFTLLRNGWYIENYTGTLATALEHGAILGSAGEGRVAAATRADYAGAAAAVVTGEGHEGEVYELAGDTAFTMAELAETITQVSGTKVVYQDLPAEEYAKALAGFGVPEAMAGVLADSDQGVKRGELANGSGDLARLLGRPTTALANAVRAALPA